MIFFRFSDHLEPCHECWKVKQRMGTVGSICQFEGFRKVRRIAAGQTKPFRFEADGFLDPFSDPTEEDKVLWTKPTKKGNNVELFLKYIFCLVKDSYCDCFCRLCII